MADTYHPHEAPHSVSLTSDDYYANGGRSEVVADRTNGGTTFGVVFSPSINLQSAYDPVSHEIVVAMELGPPGTVSSGTWPEDYKPAQRVPSHTLAEYRDGPLDSDGDSDADWSGEAGTGGETIDGVFAMAGEGTSDFYSDNVPPGGWAPGYYYEKKPRRKKVVVRASMDCQLPALDSHLEAHVTTRAVLRAVMDNRLHAMTGGSWARVRNTGTGNGTPLPVLRAALQAAAISRAAMHSTPGPLTATARARSLARATVQADVAVSGTSTARVRVAGRTDVQLPAASIRAAGTAKPLPPTDLDAELLLIAAQLLDDDEEEWDG